MAMRPDGKVVAVGGFNSTIKRFDVATGKALESSVGEGAATALAISDFEFRISKLQSGGLLAAAFTTNQVQLFDFATGKPKHRLTCGPNDAEVLLAVSPDGQQLATASLPGSVILWTTADGKEKQRLTLPDLDEVRCLAFSPNGKQLALGCSHGGLRICNAATGKVVKQVAMENGAWAVAFAASGKTLAVGTDAGVVLLDCENLGARA